MKDIYIMSRFTVKNGISAVLLGLSIHGFSINSEDAPTSMKPSLFTSEENTRNNALLIPLLEEISDSVEGLFLTQKSTILKAIFDSVFSDSIPCPEAEDSFWGPKSPLHKSAKEKKEGATLDSKPRSQPKEDRQKRPPHYWLPPHIALYSGIL